MSFKEQTESESFLSSSSVGEDNEDAAFEPEWSHPANSRQKISSNHLFLAICGVALLILTGIFSIPAPLICPISSAPSDANKKRPTTEMTMASPCGTTRDSALRAGCYFDLMSFTWLPERCYDGELESEFLASQPWIWYHDIEGTQEADNGKVYRGEHETLFVSWDYHKTHCAFMWRKLHRAMEHDWPVDGYIGTSNHTRHCLKQLDRKGIAPEVINTQINVKWPTCPDY